MEFCRIETFHELLTRTAYCPSSLQIIVEKTFADSLIGTKQQTSHKVSPSKISRYTVQFMDVFPVPLPHPSSMVRPSHGGIVD